MADKVDVAARICWSSDGETFNADSLSELLEGDDSLKVGDVVHFGEAVEVSPRFVDSDDVIDMIADRAYDQGGECAEGFPNISDEGVEDLTAFLIAWQEKHCKPDFWTIPKPQEYRLVANDFDAASHAGASQ